MKKTILIIITAFLLSSCVNPPATGLPFKYGNDCLPQAIVMTEALRNKNIEADVLSIYTEKWGHAVCRYMYPKGQNKLYVWDHDWQSIRLRAWKDDPKDVAEEWMKATRHAEPLKYAEFLK
jgi:hypothetical protein